MKSLMAKGSRLSQVVTWLGGRDKRDECLVVLDECHKAKNLLDSAGSEYLQRERGPLLCLAYHPSPG